LQIALEKEGMQSDIYKKTLSKMLQEAHEEAMDHMMRNTNWKH
jgi:uncharacterized protein YbjQ (UPF0145 family)